VALNSVVLNGTVGLLFPWTRTGRGRRRFSPLHFPSPFLSQNQKNPTRPTPHLMPCHWGENVDGTSPAGSCLVAAWPHYNPYAMIGQGYSPLSPFFSLINTNRETKRSKGKKNLRRWQRVKGRKKNRETKEKRRKKQTVTEVL
jgi:hypothetical protein